jgi:Cd2+/Zn2+-exporting ATPase
VKTVEGVIDATLNFINKTLKVSVERQNDVDRISTRTIEIVNFFEPHVRVLDKKTLLDSHENIEHRHKHSYESKGMKLVAIGAGLFALGLFFQMSGFPSLLLFLTAYLLAGGEVLLRAARNISRGQVFDENFLMAVATIGAFAIGEYPEGVAVMLFYQVGEYFQNMAVNKSRKSIANLMDIRPDYANLIEGEDSRKIDPELVEIGQEILIKPGEKVPLDGIVVSGTSSMDTAALTGESLPREVSQGDSVLSGFINKQGLLKVKVDKKFQESTVSKILQLVENASANKAPTESFITRFAKIYTPIVVFTALALALIPPLILEGATFKDWIYRALIFLVVSCPCALVISIPLGFFGGIGGASKQGILVKGGNYLEALNSVDTVVLDKTGTLTKGQFEVTEIHTSGIYTDNELLHFAAMAEGHSSHPIAQSIVRAYGKPLDKGINEKYTELAGMGISTIVEGRQVLVGNDLLFKERGIDTPEGQYPGTVVNIAVDGIYRGSIAVEDQIKDNAESAIKQLRDTGVKRVIMLTGDNKRSADAVASKIGIDMTYFQLLPQDKVSVLEEIAESMEKGKKLIFVGDGINDAPVLARADIGIAMGAMGSDAAIEAADVVLMTDDLEKLPAAIKIARKTRRIVWQNIAFAMGVKGIVLLLGAGGLATMWEAVFADVGVAVIAVLNSMRAMKS